MEMVLWVRRGFLRSKCKRISGWPYFPLVPNTQGCKIISWKGFHPKQTQPESTLLWIKLLLCTVLRYQSLF